MSLTAAPSDLNKPSSESNDDHDFFGHIHSGYSTARPNLALVVHRGRRKTPATTPRPPPSLIASTTPAGLRLPLPSYPTEPTRKPLTVSAAPAQTPRTPRTTPSPTSFRTPTPKSTAGTTSRPSRPKTTREERPSTYPKHRAPYR